MTDAFANQHLHGSMRTACTLRQTRVLPLIRWPLHPFVGFVKICGNCSFKCITFEALEMEVAPTTTSFSVPPLYKSEPSITIIRSHFNVDPRLHNAGQCRLYRCMRYQISQVRLHSTALHLRRLQETQGIRQLMYD